MNINNTPAKRLILCLSFGILPMLNTGTSSLQASMPHPAKNQKKYITKAGSTLIRTVRKISTKILPNLSTNG